MDPWDAAAPGYDGVMRLAGWRREQRALVTDLSGTVLDMGCGTGYMATLLGHRYVGLDRSPAMRAHAPAPVVVADAAAAPFARRRLRHGHQHGLPGAAGPVLAGSGAA